MGNIFATCGHELKSMEDGVGQERTEYAGVSDGTYWGYYCKKCAKEYDEERTMRICVICPVRKGTPDEVYAHVGALEGSGHLVFFPTRDIPQTIPETGICQRMLLEIDLADEVHVWYSPDSQGVHFYMGILFSTLSDSECRVKPTVKWLNPVENPVGYEAVLKEMCKK